MQEDESVLTRPAPAPDAVLSYGADDAQVADLRHGSGDAHARPLLVLVHGGFWRPQYGRDQLGPMACALAAAGWTVAVPAYRRVPGNPDLSVADVVAAIGALPKRADGHDGRVVIVGHSAGGHLALLAALAAAVPPQAVLGLAPAADLARAHALGLGGGAVADYLGGAPETRPELDPQRRPAPPARTLLLHGDADAAVPLEISERYAAAHPGVELQRLPGCGHFALIDPLSRDWPAVVAALRRLGDDGLA